MTLALLIVACIAVLADAYLTRLGLRVGLGEDNDVRMWLIDTMAEAGYHFRSGGIVSGTYSLETDGSGWDSYGLRCEVPMKRVRLVSTWEHLDFATLAGEPTQGDRVTLGALVRFGSGG